MNAALLLTRNLSNAAISGDVAICRAYIERGDDVNATSSIGNTALHYGAQCGHLNVCRLLIGRGRANIHATNHDGLTPLHYAARNGRVDVCRLLLNRRANVNATNNLGRTPLHYAAAQGHVEVCRLLVNRRANIHITDNQGLTPLHYAAARGHVEVCRLLIDRGANIHTTNNNDRTPLDLAIEHHSVEVLTYFYVHGVVDFHAPDHTGIRPWDRLTEAERVALNQVVHDRVHTILALRSTVLPKDLSNEIMRYL